jgi:hypothetical protein
MRLTVKFCTIISRVWFNVVFNLGGCLGFQLINLGAFAPAIEKKMSTLRPIEAKERGNGKTTISFLALF